MKPRIGTGEKLVSPIAAFRNERRPVRNQDAARDQVRQRFADESVAPTAAQRVATEDRQAAHAL